MVDTGRSMSWYQPRHNTPIFHSPPPFCPTPTLTATFFSAPSFATHSRPSLLYCYAPLHSLLPRSQTHLSAALACWCFNKQVQQTLDIHCSFLTTLIHTTRLLYVHLHCQKHVAYSPFVAFCPNSCVCYIAAVVAIKPSCCHTS